MPTFLTQILSYITSAVPFIGIPGEILSAIEQEVAAYQAVNGNDADLQAAIVALRAANDAAYTATEAKLEALDKVPETVPPVGSGVSGQPGGQSSRTQPSEVTLAECERQGEG